MTHCNKNVKSKRREENTKSSKRKKSVTYKGTPIRQSADFSAVILHARREWHDIFQGLEGKNLQPRKSSKAIIHKRRNKDFLKQKN